MAPCAEHTSKSPETQVINSWVFDMSSEIDPCRPSSLYHEDTLNDVDQTRVHHGYEAHDRADLRLLYLIRTFGGSADGN